MNINEAKAMRCEVCGMAMNYIYDAEEIYVYCDDMNHPEYVYPLEAQL